MLIYMLDVFKINESQKMINRFSRRQSSKRKFMSTFSSLYIFCISVLLDKSQSEIQWNNVKKVSALNRELCMQQCADDYHCSNFSFDLENGCYLESGLLSDIKEQFLVNKTLTSDKLTGTYRDKRKEHLNMDHVSIQHLLPQPIATDSRTLLNFPQYFVKGCSYTITIWVWLWKNDRHGRNKRESIVFSTRQMNPKNDNDDEILLPAIIFDIMKYPGSFFFSTTKDASGDYSGFSPPTSVKYHEWTHIAMTIEDGFVNAYINGEFLQKASFASSTRKCPHTSSTRDFKFYDGSPNNINIHNNENAYGNDDKDKNQEEIISNTIFQVAGGKHIPSIPGMVQDVMIYRNVALSEDHIQQVMKFKRPVISKTLNSLMSLYGLYSLEGYSVKQWEDNYYLMIEWGICPGAVCGSVCLDEKFLLGHVSMKSNRSGGSDGVKIESQEYNKGKVSDLIQSVDDYFGEELVNLLQHSEKIEFYGEDIYVNDFGYYSSEAYDNNFVTSTTDYHYGRQYNLDTYDEIDLDLDPYGSFDMMNRHQGGGAVERRDSESKSGLKSNRMNKINKIIASSYNEDVTYADEQSFDSGYKVPQLGESNDDIVSGDESNDEISDEVSYNDRLKIKGTMQPFDYLPRRCRFSYKKERNKNNRDLDKSGVGEEDVNFYHPTGNILLIFTILSPQFAND
jgi:hypothetical protein